MRFIFVCLLIIPQFLIAQKQFAPLGATWRYEQHTFDCSNHFLRYNVEKEMEIDGKDCSIIYSYTSRNLNPFQKSEDSLIVWENDQKVYFYQFDEFHLLYDFTLEIGDTLEYYLPSRKGHFSPYEDEQSDTAVIVTQLYVVDIEEVEVNGLMLKRFDTRYTYPEDGFIHYMDYIVENVGATNSKIIGNNEIFVASGCGPGFLCYENENFSYPPDIQCEYPTSTIENNTSEKIQLVEVINMSGQKITEFGSVSSAVRLDNISKGFYFIKLTFDSGFTHIAKIVKY